MSRTADVIDLNSYRVRRQARRMAELMWSMYALRSGYAAYQLVQSGSLDRSREA